MLSGNVGIYDFDDNVEMDVEKNTIHEVVKYQYVLLGEAVLTGSGRKRDENG